MMKPLVEKDHQPIAKGIKWSHLEKKKKKKIKEVVRSPITLMSYSPKGASLAFACKRLMAY